MAVAVGALWRGRWSGAVMRPGRLWWLLKRDAKRGVRAAYHHYRTLPKIVRWQVRNGLGPPEAVPLHLLTRGEDWLLGCWMLASWFEATGKNWRVVVHDDGTLGEEGRRVLRGMIPALEIAGKQEADERMELVLEKFPRARAYRAGHALARKLFDASERAGGGRYMAFDSDVLFFSRPDQMLREIAGDPLGSWFNRDVAEGSLVPAEEALRVLGVPLWERVNSGIALVGEGVVDLGFCERALAETGLLRGHPWRVEQTLYALCASRVGAGGLLGEEYEISLGHRASPGVVCRHYVGAVRERFYAEGVARLRRALGL